MDGVSALLTQSRGRGGSGGVVNRPAVCLFTDSREPSGVGAVILALARKLRDRFRLSLICPPTEGGRRLLAAADGLGVATLGADALRDVPDWHRARDWLRAQDVELLHIHAGIAWEGLTAPNLARAAGVRRTLRHEHLPDLLTAERDRRAYRDAMREVDAILCVSQGVRESLERAEVPASKLHVVRNGIDTPAASPDRPRDSTVLCVGRHVYQKGHTTLLRAWPEVATRVPGAALDIVGTGPLEPGLRAMARRLGIESSTRFLGQRDDVPGRMARAGCVVLPSRWEGLPLVLLEAIMLGAPAVATAVCGSAEVIEDGVTGRLVPPDEPAALAAALVHVLRDPDGARGMGMRARALVRSRFTAAHMAAETAAHYERSLGADAPVTPAALSRIMEYA